MTDHRNRRLVAARNYWRTEARILDARSERDEPLDPYDEERYWHVHEAADACEELIRHRAADADLSVGEFMAQYEENADA